uniref:Uncharacterized protein n=1 Tax=Schistocephalus solidus TaxID=70667 RepID=A0A0X3PCX1_SCHSO
MLSSDLRRAVDCPTSAKRTPSAGSSASNVILSFSTVISPPFCPRFPVSQQVLSAFFNVFSFSFVNDAFRCCMREFRLSSRTCISFSAFWFARRAHETETICSVKSLLRDCRSAHLLCRPEKSTSSGRAEVWTWNSKKTLLMLKKKLCKRRRFHLRELTIFFETFPTHDPVQHRRARTVFAA